MADNDMLFLVQWEDRFMSVIERNDIVSPLKAQHEYSDGEVIVAVYGKNKQKKRYEAVICEMHRFPNVVGAVDGTQIPIQAPKEHEEDYVNRKGFHAINAQMICDASFKFLNVVARWPGSVHDSRVFRESEISTRFEEGELIGNLIGDSGYPCKRYLLTPYLSPRTPAQERFNVSLCKTRVIIEQCFGILKRRFPCLSYRLRVPPSRAAKIIAACVVLHNIGLNKANKKFLTVQAKLPPKITFFEAKRLQSVEKRSDAPAVNKHVVPSSVKPVEKLKLSDAPAVNKDAAAVNRHVVPSSVKPVSEDVPGSHSTSTSHKVKKLPDVPTVDKHVRVVVPSVKPEMDDVGLHSPASKSKKDSGWEDECRSMRRKIRKIEDRVSEMEKNVQKRGSDEDDAMSLVGHLNANNHMDVVSVLAQHFFTAEELKSHSRTGKKLLNVTGNRGQRLMPPNCSKFKGSQ